MHSTSPHATRRTAALLTVALAGAGLAATPPTAASAPASRVVVTSLTGDVAGAARAVQAAGGKVLDRLSLIGGVSATLPVGTVLAPTYRVVSNSPLHVASKDKDSGNGNGNDGNSNGKDGSNEGQDKAAGPASGVRETIGLGPANGEGRGVTVAVVDTGVADVPDLAGRVTHINVSKDATPGDGYGHGTFVAGLVAGDGKSSQGAYAGVAPAARILDVKVANAAGDTDLVTVLKGLQAVAGAHADVVNLSLSSGSPLPYQIDPLSAALEALWRRGVTVVVPAGNDGDKPGTIASPGNDPVLLTAGGLDENGTASRSDDTIATWSGRGPASQGVQKPDLAAPGAHVVSLAAPGSVVAQGKDTTHVGDSYIKGSGTSFSTAVTSGAVAALLADRPDLSPFQVKSLLTGTAYRARGLSDRDAAGAGGLDLASALDATAKKDKRSEEATSIPGDPAVWAAFLNALLSGDQAAAASSWSKLSQAARNWAASSWSSLSWDARNWAARNWAASSWSGGDWAARNWAARNWAARNWADSDWSASSWSARNWAASSWSARNWAEDDWAARNWAASSWSARNWAAAWH